jgi:hypothetical protein
VNSAKLILGDAIGPPEIVRRGATSRIVAPVRVSHTPESGINLLLRWNSLGRQSASSFYYSIGGARPGL